MTADLYQEAPEAFISRSDAAESPGARQLEDRQLVKVALAAMTSRQRVVFLQHELYGDTPEQIAGYLEISASRVRGILSEAKAVGRRAIEAALSKPKEGTLSLVN